MAKSRVSLCIENACHYESREYARPPAIARSSRGREAARPRGRALAVFPKTQLTGAIAHQRVLSVQAPKTVKLAEDEADEADRTEEGEDDESRGYAAKVGDLVGIEAPKVHVNCLCTGGSSATTCAREQYRNKYAIVVRVLGNELVVRMLSKGGCPSAHVKVACSEVHVNDEAQVTEWAEYKKLLEMEVGPQPTRPRRAAMPTTVVEFQHEDVAKTYDVQRWRSAWLQQSTGRWLPVAVALFEPGDGVDQTCVAWTPKWMSGPHTEYDVHVGPDSFCTRCNDPMLEQHISFLFHNPVYDIRDGICTNCARLDVPCVVCGGAPPTGSLPGPKAVLLAALQAACTGGSDSLAVIRCISCQKPVCLVCMAVHFPYWTKFEVIPRGGYGFQCGGCEGARLLHLK
jgi:hypothetical protein